MPFWQPLSDGLQSAQLASARWRSGTDTEGATQVASAVALVERELELRFLSGQLLYLREQLSTSARLAAATGVGEDGLGLEFDNAAVAYFIGSVALAIIL